jgi:NADPH:quinone reductase-like Zn-dependent oxidoreductase
MALPPSMKAAVATGFGDIDKNIFLRNDWPTPTMDPDDEDHLIIRVLACALAPGDARVLSGNTAYVQLPEGPPYVIGSDVSGIVLQAPTSSKFRAGDYVISRFDEPKPQGGVAEYRKVLIKLTEKCPDTISPIVACGLPASAMAAKRVVTDFVREGHRVLVIGGSGAVGSSAIQYAKLQGASFIAAVSSQGELCKRLGADQVVDYRNQKWWEVPDFQKQKFDVVIDLVNGDNWTVGAYTRKAIKGRGGTYVGLMTGVGTEILVRGMMDIFPLMIGMVGRILWSRLDPRIPKWVSPEALLLEDGDLKGLLEDVESGRLEPLVDPQSPFDFDEEGVRKAMALLKSKHAHGKVVIEIGKK